MVVEHQAAGGRIPVEQTLDGLAAEDRLPHDLGGVVGLHALVEEPLGVDDDQRAILAQAVASGDAEVDGAGKAALRQGLLEGGRE
jgi:hypothetical protein